MSDIVFGTDGWRGRIAEDYTFANVRRCSQGFADYLRRTGDAANGVVIGYDKRFAAEDFAAAAAEVMAANGIRVWLTEGATPTPTISYGVVDKGAGAGINITASHNPPHDCGFKVRDSGGGAIPPALLKEIEALIPADEGGARRVKLDDALSDGRVTLFDAGPAYVRQIGRLVDLEPLKQAGFDVMVDCMWGNGAGWFPKLLAGGRTSVSEVHNERNPIFPHMSRPEPIHPNIDDGLAAARQAGADVTIINDGDADRVGFGDEHGQFIDQLRAYGLLGYYFLEVRGERGPIVKTVSTTKMLNKLGKIYDVPVYETGVGFKYIAPKMVEVDALLGGEESGGYAFRNHVPERDGILAGLYMLDFMVQTGKKPSQLLEQLFELVGPHYYERVDSAFDMERKAEIQRNVATARPERIGGLRVEDIVTIDGHQFVMEDGGWVLVRFSGTEPIIRVYCETTHEDRVDAIIEDGMRLAGLAQAG
ncbi:MAG: phosphoglucomutase/phosphomannomutase family protein [Candidatus Promineifilaceae bacterium]